MTAATPPRTRGPLARLDDCRIRTKIAGVAVLFSLAMTAVAGLGVEQLSEASTHRQSVLEADVPYLAALQQAALEAKAAATDERGFLISGKADFAESFTERQVEIEGELAEATDLARSSSDRERIAAVQTSIDTWTTAVQAEFLQFADDPAGATDVALGANRDLRKDFEAKFHEAVTIKRAALVDSGKQADASSTRAVQLVAIALLVGLALPLLLAVRVIRGITGPLGAVVTALKAAATGDLTQRVTPARPTSSASSPTRSTPPSTAPGPPWPPSPAAPARCPPAPPSSRPWPAGCPGAGRSPPPRSRPCPPPPRR